MSKFTPGPWRIVDKGIRAEKGYICFLADWPHHYEGQDKRYADELVERDANAHLIAAAPDLYEACRGAVVTIEALFADLGRDPSNNDNYCRLKDVLLKVEGGRP
jgi:hypothetical protein